MSMKIATVQLWVHDQDAALEFWTKKVGFQVTSDVTVPEMGNFRWLAVGPVSQPDVSICLMALPGQPIMDDKTQEQVLDVVGKGFAGSVFLTTEDVDGDYARLVAQGVEFVDKPEDRLYGRDCGFRDPSGNHVRLTQLNPDFPS
ncbi:VOC family protein [Kitasatospora viridis]|uniref:Putative glyoxalase superfamily protein PhnB n=1 Tax=Kitasatospora viridis TaxID=281105 RepID=A0A561SF99_9ACTN|nr:VOC family protein [Kitasatospora viridis]TWF73544.1 putative glyoxalase superfamily protein PhnB [Kitasatospora viridis]